MVLFFNGFCFNGIDVGYNDFVYVDGVSDEKRIKELVDEYKDVKDLIVVCYSFGVYYGNIFLNELNRDDVKTIAICGTPHSMNKEDGINPLLIKMMLKAMSIETMADFFIKVGYRKEITLERATFELESMLYNYIEYENKFDTLIYAKNDQIFKPEALVQQYKTCYGINAEHYIFGNKEFDEKFREILGDWQKI